MTTLAPAGYLGGLVVAVVLAVAAGSKAGRTAATTTSFAGLGLPGAALLARAVPAAELAVAVALAVAPRAGSVAASVLLLAFTGVLARAASRHGGVACACFGSVGTAPVSAVEFVRNGFLLTGAVGAAAATRPEAPTVDAVVAVGSAALIAGLVLALLALRRDVGAVWKVALAGEPTP